MKIASITAGAGGMYCGSCMKDNTLAHAIHQLGHECLLIPCYTPLRLDEPVAGESQVFLSGLTMYLQQKYSMLRRIPGFLARWMANPWLLRKVSGSTVKINAADLAPMTISLLQGTQGHQVSEIKRLVDWLAGTYQPDVILLTNVLLSGIIPELQRCLQVPVFTTLQGDDVFLDELPEKERHECIALIRQNCSTIAGHIATCQAYADYMAKYLDIPRSQISVVYPGIETRHYRPHHEPEPKQGPLKIGYLARIAPEKGFHVLVDALCHLQQMQGIPPWTFEAAGYCTAYRKDYLEEQRLKAEKAGWGKQFHYAGELDGKGKATFLSGLDIFSVPATFLEPKGLYVLEA